ncbi:MAG: SDR family NAD(P)-dependent oxidoreductase [Bryobacteraceae bacterium]
MRIQGKVALITGASEGIGAACVEEFRKRGARLSLVARNEEKLRQVGGAEACIAAGDITQPETRERALARTLERFGSVDILINNAGIGMYAPAWKAPMAEVRRMFELNLFAPLELVQLVAPHMRERGSGTIVNVSSMAGQMTLPWFTLYSASKFALNALTDGLRMELQPDNIRCISVCPGYVRTEFQSHVLAGQPPDRILRGKRFAITAGQCASAIADAVERDTRTVVTPRIGRLLIALRRMFPSIVDGKLAALYHGDREAG